MAVAIKKLNISYFPYPRVFAAHEAEFVRIFTDVCRRGAFIKQRELSEFEQDLAQYMGAKYAIGVGNATDALHFCLRAAGIGLEDEVIFSSHTMLATATAIHFAGAIPVPVDCGADHLISASAVEAAITSRTRAILPTQLNGRTAQMNALQDIADRYNLIIIEDAAQALGARFKGRMAGTFGVASAISFYPAKVLGCFGDGGAIVTNSEAVYEKALSLCDFGRDKDGKVVRWGMNSRLDNVQAAFLHFQLQYFPKVVERRREIARRYEKHLSVVPQVSLPPRTDDDPDHFDVFQNYEIEADRRDELKNHMENAGVGTLIPWGGVPVHQCDRLGFEVTSLAHTNKLFTRVLMLPMNQFLEDSDVDAVCECIKGFYGIH